MKVSGVVLKLKIEPGISPDFLKGLVIVVEIL